MTNRNNTFSYKTMRRLALATFIGLSGAPSSFSQEAEADGTNDAFKEQAAPKRDPFWPVGYVPESIRRADAEKNQEVVAPVANRVSFRQRPTVQYEHGLCELCLVCRA